MFMVLLLLLLTALVVMVLLLLRGSAPGSATANATSLSSLSSTGNINRYYLN